MSLQAASVETLRRSTIEDVYTILGWAPDNLLRWLFLQDGPLLVLASHPGTFDSMLLAAALRRDDLRIIAWEWPLLQRLTATSRHIIFTSGDPHQRMGVFRRAIGRLRAGDALLLYPSSDLDPDPDIQPGSEDALQRWSPSIEPFLRNERPVGHPPRHNRSRRVAPGNSHAARAPLPARIPGFGGVYRP